VTLSIPAPAQDADLSVKWRLHNAGNTWFWAIDNVKISTEAPFMRASSPFGPKRAVVVGIDGVRVDSLAAANTPNIDALARSGVHSFSAIASKGQATSSGPGWSSILTGVWTEKHGVVDNSFTGARYDEWPTLLTRVKEAQPAAFTASIINWAPIHYHIDMSIDYQRTGLKDDAVAAETARVITEMAPDVTFVHLDEVDGAGHTYGYQPEAKGYLAALERADAQVGQIVEAIEERKTAHPDEAWLIVVLSDHGGTKEKGHGGLSEEEVLVPFIAAGSGIAPGEIEGQAAIVDVVPTVLSYLDMPVEAAAFDGEPRLNAASEMQAAAAR
jgi:arylsulfatase A-like enzyme